MRIDDPKIISLTERVEAACGEVEMAIQFHEAWRPAAFDADLMGRMSHSYAGNTFLVVRTALRREVLLGLMRLWDKDARALNLCRVAEDLSDSEVIDALATDRAARLPIPGVAEAMRKELQDGADACRALIGTYLPGGTRAEVLVRLRDIRNRQLAHRQMKPVEVVRPEPARDEVEDLYVDMLELIGRLYSLVKAVSYNLADTAGVHRHYAGLFWEAARSERAHGHPRHRPEPPPPS